MNYTVSLTDKVVHIREPFEILCPLVLASFFCLSSLLFLIYTHTGPVTPEKSLIQTRFDASGLVTMPFLLLGCPPGERLWPQAPFRSSLWSLFSSLGQFIVPLSVLQRHTTYNLPIVLIIPHCIFFLCYYFCFLNLIYLFVYLFMAVLGLRFCARAFSSCGKRGPLFIAVRGPLTVAASLVAEHRLQTRRLSNCGSRA